METNFYFIENKIGDTYYIGDTSDGVLEAYSKAQFQALLERGFVILSPQTASSMLGSKESKSSNRKLYNELRKDWRFSSEWLKTHCLYSLVHIIAKGTVEELNFDGSKAFDYNETDGFILVAIPDNKGCQLVLKICEDGSAGYQKIGGSFRNYPSGSGYLMRQVFKREKIHINGGDDFVDTALYLLTYMPDNTTVTTTPIQGANRAIVGTCLER